MTELVLFDIDGTLVDVRGAGRRAFVAALERTWGIVDAESDLRRADVSFAGATDLGVLRQLRQRLALDEPHEPAFFVAMEQTLLVELEREKPRLYDGVERCLARFAAPAPAGRGDVVLGFVTGNAMRCAHVKIEAAGIDRGRFVVGGYGDEHHDRPTLARMAKERAEQFCAEQLGGHGFDRVLLIGDTPSDIAAARHIGAVAIGVTTGHFGRQQLTDAGADLVVDSLDQLP